MGVSGQAILERTLCCKRVCQLRHEVPLPLMSFNVMAKDDAHLLHLQQNSAGT